MGRTGFTRAQTKKSRQQGNSSIQRLPWTTRTLAEDALTAYGEVARRFGESENPSVLEWAAIALVSKVLVLQRLHRADNALAICDEVARRFGTGETPILVQQVAMALVIKGLALHEIDRTDEALVACDEVVHRFGEERDTNPGSAGRDSPS